MRCVFCQNWEISHRSEGFHLKTEELVQWMVKLQEAGCHNINFVTPEHVAPQVALAICEAARQGLKIPVVYNTSAYDCEDSLSLMDGLVDIYMPDFKVWENETSQRLLKVKDYPEVAKQAIKEMNRQVGFLRFTADGLAKQGVLVRHLVMPGKVAESVKIMRWISENLGNDAYVHIMEQYKPDAHVGRQDVKRSGDVKVRYEEINRPTGLDEIEVHHDHQSTSAQAPIRATAVDVELITAALNIKKTKKKATACDACYRLRRKCDSATPACGPCAKTKSTCTYIRRFVSPSLIQRKARKDGGSYAQQLEQRLASMETIVRGVLTNIAQEAANTNGESSGKKSPVSSIASQVNVIATPKPPPQPMTTSSFPTFQSTPESWMQPPSCSPNDFAFKFEESLLDSAFPFFTPNPLSTPNAGLSTSSHAPFAPYHSQQTAHPSSPMGNLVDLMEQAFDTQLSFKKEEDAPTGLGLTKSPSVGPIWGSESPESEGTPPVNFHVTADEQDRLLKIFFSQVNATLPMQFIHEGVFYHELSNNIDPCPALLLAMCAIARAAGPSFAFDGSFWPHIGYEPHEAPSQEEGAKTPDDVAETEHIFTAAIAALDFDHPSLKMCQALFLMISMLRLDVDPDTLEAKGEKFTWYQKELRRRLFAMALTIDIFDIILRERCSGLWRRPSDVKLPQVFHVWSQIEPATGNLLVAEPADQDLGLQYYTFSLTQLLARILDYNLANNNPFPGISLLRKNAEDAMNMDDPMALLDTRAATDPDFTAIDQDLRAYYSSLPLKIRNLDAYDRFRLGGRMGDD
ncbi:hypothetical protein HDU96_001134, partial [Phlyctochytrium bullatum]